MDVFEPATHRSTRERDGGVGECSGIGRIDLGAQPIEEVSLGFEQIGLANEYGNQVSARSSTQHRQQFETDSVAQESTIRIGGILERSPSETNADLHSFGTSDSEQWVANASARTSDRSHADQTIETRTAQQVDDHRFSSVICGVSRTHVIGKDAVARRAGPGFDIWSEFDSDATRFEFRSEFVGGTCDDLAFSVGIRSQSVVDMDRRDIESGSACQCEESQ